MQYGSENTSNVTNEAARVETEHANEIAPRSQSNFEVAWRKHRHPKFMGHLEINFNHELIKGKSSSLPKWISAPNMSLVESYS